MGKLVHRDVVAIIEVARAAFDTIPGKDHDPGVPGFAKPDRLRRFIREKSFPARDIGARVDKNGPELRVNAGFTIQEQHAGVRADGDSDLFGQFKSAAAFKMLGGHHDVHASMQRVALIN